MDLTLLATGHMPYPPGKDRPGEVCLSYDLVGHVS